MRKTFFLTLIFLFSFVLSNEAKAENFSLTSYYPAPSGNYESIHLTSQAALNPSNCQLGTIYANSDDNSLPYYCGPTLGSPTFAAISGPWTLSGNNIFLTDTTTPLNKKVGLGTITPTFKLTLENDGGILADGLASTSSALTISGTGTRLIWYPLKGAFRAGYVTATEWDNANIGTSSMAMGYGNIAANTGATVWGGQNNSASSGASPYVPVITGGLSNTTTSELAQILGGSSNSAGIGTRVAGQSNSGSGNYTMIGGGRNHSITSNYGTIAGGFTNASSVTNVPTISGGAQNTSTGNDPNNPSNYTTISGGAQNILSTGFSYSTISGGQSNTSNTTYSVVSGGKSNTVSGTYPTISGGFSNTASNFYPTISGGSNNIANCSGNGSRCSVGGGKNNTSNAASSTVNGGLSNVNTGFTSIIPGGANNTVGDIGVSSMAAGKYMNTSSMYSFVWGYSNSAITAISAHNVIIVYSGSMGIRDIDPAALLEINRNNVAADDYLNLTSTTVATAGNIFKIKNNGFVGVNQSSPLYPLHFGNGAYVSADGNFISSSSRRSKENIRILSTTDALATFLKLKPVQYNYKNEPAHRYLGFIAEDVPDLIADKHHQGLSPLDIVAMLSKVIAHQQETLKTQQKETEALRKEFLILKNKIQNHRQPK